MTCNIRTRHSALYYILFINHRQTVTICSLTMIIIVRKLINDKDSFMHWFHVQGTIYRVFNSKELLFFYWSWILQLKYNCTAKECHRLSFLLIHYPLGSLSEWWLVNVDSCCNYLIKDQAFILLRRHAWNKPTATYDSRTIFIDMLHLYGTRGEY